MHDHVTPTAEVPELPNLPGDLRSPESDPVAVLLARLEPGSRRAYASGIRKVVEMLAGDQAQVEGFPWSRVGYQHVQAVRSKLAEQHSAGYANRILASLRGVIREAWRLGQVDHEHYAKIADVPNVKGGSTVRKGHALRPDEIRNLFLACRGDSLSCRRDAAMLTTLYPGGLRRAEACALALEDYDPFEATLTVRRGKGRKDREVPMPGWAARIIDRWLDVRGDDPGRLLLRVRNGRIEPHGLSTHAVYLRLKVLADRAGVRDFTPHDLRRTITGDYLDLGADISVVSAMLGHASPKTTAGYDRRGKRAKRSAADRVPDPGDADA